MIIKIDILFIVRVVQARTAAVFKFFRILVCLWLAGDWRITYSWPRVLAQT